MLPQLVSPDAGTFHRRDVWRSKFYTGYINLCRNWGGALIGACVNCLLSSIECFHSRDQHICKFIGTRESIYKRKEFNSHRTRLEHQCGRRDVMWKRSIIKDHCAESTKKHLFLRNNYICLVIYSQQSTKFYGNINNDLMLQYGIVGNKMQMFLLQKSPTAGNDEKQLYSQALLSYGAIFLVGSSNCWVCGQNFMRSV